MNTPRLTNNKTRNDKMRGFFGHTRTQKKSATRSQVPPKRASLVLCVAPSSVRLDALWLRRAKGQREIDRDAQKHVGRAQHDGERRNADLPGGRESKHGREYNDNY
jgi:hypothetical protein